jgi:UPI00017B3849 related cluster
MVAIHKSVGDKINPYLSSLNGSKMKLLQLYIDRAENKTNQSSECVSNGSSVSSIAS